MTLLPALPLLWTATTLPGAHGLAAPRAGAPRGGVDPCLPSEPTEPAELSEPAEPSDSGDQPLRCPRAGGIGAPSAGLLARSAHSRSSAAD